MLTILNGASLSKELIGLAKYTEYEARILAFTSVGDGPKSEVKLVKTNEDGRYSRIVKDQNLLIRCKAAFQAIIKSRHSLTPNSTKLVSRVLIGLYYSPPSCRRDKIVPPEFNFRRVFCILTEIN